MTIQEKLALACYNRIADLNAEHNVFLVQHEASGKIYVEKILSRYNLNVFRYLMEHPVSNTPRIYEAVEDEGRLIIIEDYIPGSTLQEQLDEQGYLPKEQAVDIVNQLCRIVDQLHHAEPPIIHRDIKPSNIIVDTDGAVKLLDMNAARQYADKKNEDTTLLGTMGYAAPEQFGFAESSVQTDIYSIGVLMNVLLTGQLPKDRLADGKLGAIISHCTKLDPKERYSSVRILLAALDTVKKGGKRQAGKDQTWRRFLPPGFRALKPLYMILAVIGYGVLFDLGLTMEVNNYHTAGDILAYRIAVTVMLLAMVLFSGNYLNVQSAVPLAKSKNWGIRISGILLGNLAILLLTCIVLSFFVH